jgi:hypothetical protein
MSDQAERGEWPTNELPPTWLWVSFSDFFRDSTESRRKLPKSQYKSEGQYQVIDQGEDPIGGFSDDENLLSRASLPCVVWGDHTKCIKFVRDRFIQGADGVKVLEPLPGVDPLFAYSALQAVRLPDKGYSRHFKFVSSTRFPMPPISEQRRIVAKLGALSSRSKRACAELDRIPALIERYKEAALKKAFTGEITADWRLRKGLPKRGHILDRVPAELAEEELPASWKSVPISSAVENHDGRRIPIKRADRALRRGVYAYYGASGAIDTIDEYIFEGDFLLIAEDGANLLARSTPISFEVSGKFWVNNHAHVVRARPGVTSNTWIKSFMNWINLAPYVTGSAQPKLTQGKMNTICVPLPSIEEQREILLRLQTAFASIDRVSSEREKAASLLPRLQQELLAKAFRGELVPQDPNEEPASMLLERIRAGRATKGRPTARRRRLP